MSSIIFNGKKGRDVGGLQVVTTANALACGWWFLVLWWIFYVAGGESGGTSAAVSATNLGRPLFSEQTSLPNHNERNSLREDQLRKAM